CTDGVLHLAGIGWIERHARDRPRDRIHVRSDTVESQGRRLTECDPRPTEWIEEEPPRGALEQRPQHVVRLPPPLLVDHVRGRLGLGAHVHVRRNTTTKSWRETPIRPLVRRWEATQLAS